MDEPGQERFSLLGLATSCSAPQWMRGGGGVTGSRLAVGL